MFGLHFRTPEINSYLPREVKIKCVGTVTYTDEYCIECDKIRPYLEGKCLYCGGDNPVGEWCDDNITQLEWDKYFKEYGKRI